MLDKQIPFRQQSTLPLNNMEPLRYLVNNVGLTNLHKDLDVVNLDLEEWDWRMDVNLKSVLLGSRFAIPHMIKA